MSRRLRAQLIIFERIQNAKAFLKKPQHMRTCDKRAKGTLDGTSIDRNMFEHRLNARGPGAVKQRARRASEGTQKTKKLTVFFGCAQRRRYTPQRVRVNMKQCHTNTQTRNARGPGAVSNARGKQAKAPKNKETSSGAAKRSAERPKRHACTLLRNIPKHKLSTRGPGAVSDARTEQTKALQKQRNFFGRSKTLSRAPKTPHARAFAKQIKTQTERQRPRRILAAHGEPAKAPNKQRNLFGRSETLSRASNTPRTQQYRSMQQ